MSQLWQSTPPPFSPGQAVRVVENQQNRRRKRTSQQRRRLVCRRRNWFGAFFFDDELKPANDTKTHKRLRDKI